MNPALLRLHGAGDGSVMAYCGECREPLPPLPRPATLAAAQEAWDAHCIAVHITPDPWFDPDAASAHEPPPF